MPAMRGVLVFVNRGREALLGLYPPVVSRRTPNLRPFEGYLHTLNIPHSTRYTPLHLMQCARYVPFRRSRNLELTKL
jgi:hypothetical protein